MSTFFAWNTADYSVWVHDMDAEHQVLINIMNKLHDRHLAKASRTELKTIVDELVTYTKKHFADEEHYLDSIKFPEVKTHKVIHKQLLEKLEGFGKKFTLGEPLSQEFFDFLKGWLSAHIRGIDRKYGEFSKTLK